MARKYLYKLVWRATEMAVSGAGTFEGNGVELDFSSPRDRAGRHGRARMGDV